MCNLRYITCRSQASGTHFRSVRSVNHCHFGHMSIWSVWGLFCLQRNTGNMADCDSEDGDLERLGNLEHLYKSNLLRKRFRGTYLGVNEVLSNRSKLDVIQVEYGEGLNLHFPTILTTVREQFGSHVWTGIVGPELRAETAHRFDDYSIYTPIRIRGLKQHETYIFSVQNVHVIEWNSVKYDMGANIELRIVCKF